MLHKFYNQNNLIHSSLQIAPSMFPAIVFHGISGFEHLIRFVKWWRGLFLIFFMRCYRIALIDNQLLHPVLKSLVGVLAEIYLDNVSGVP